MKYHFRVIRGLLKYKHLLFKHKLKSKLYYILVIKHIDVTLFISIMYTIRYECVLPFNSSVLFLLFIRIKNTYFPT